MKKFLKRLLIFIIIIILLLATAFGLYVFKFYKEIQLNGGQEYQVDSTQTKTKVLQKNIATNKSRQLAEGSVGNYWIGTSSPKITIVEFSDFECQFCAQSFPKIRELSIKHKDDIKIIYRDFPLKEFSMDLSIGARCAGEQDLFWLMHDKLFQNQGKINTKENIIDLARSMGLNITKFQNCLNSDRHKAYIQKDFTDGSDLNISGTPTWFINGNKIEGDLPLEAWEEIIEKILNNN